MVPLAAIMAWLGSQWNWIHARRAAFGHQAYGHVWAATPIDTASWSIRLLGEAGYPVVRADLVREASAATEQVKQVLQVLFPEAEIYAEPETASTLAGNAPVTQ